MLLVDIGNSRLKWALSDGRTLGMSGALAHGDGAADELLREAWGGLSPPERVVCASVAGAIWRERLTDWCDRHWGLAPEFVASRARCAGVVNGYTRPERLGVDRWMALLGAWHAWGGPACVIDCGTALTIDALDDSGRHLGGLIVPGLRLMRQSLFDNARGIAPEAPGRAELLGRDTRAAVTGGTLFAEVACIERVVADLRDILGPAICLVLTGGDAPELLPLLRGPYRHDPDLVLRGLAAAATEECV